jgi:hypothetical protein
MRYVGLYGIFGFDRRNGNVVGSQMSSLRRIAAIAHTTAELAAQLRELHRLREMVRKAELARWPRVDRRKRTRIRRLEPRSRLSCR